MLDAIRKRTNSVISSFIILLTAAVMGMWGVERLRDTQDTSAGGAAAYVNGEVITNREFNQEYEYKMMQYQQMLGSQYDEKFMAALQIPQRVLDEMVQYKLLAQQALNLGIVVPDSELADYIRSVPYYQKDGKFDASLYSKMPNRGMEEKRQRERLRLTKFQTYLVDRIRLTPLAVRQAYALRETKLDLDYAKIDFNALAGTRKVGAAEVDAYLKSAPEADLTAYYESHKKDYTQPAAVELRQIRVGLPFQAPEPKKQEARKKIEDIAKDLKPDNFGEVAKAKSDDEYAKKGGLVGWVNRGSLEPSLEDAIDKLEINKISPPVQTSFGYYVVQVTQRKDAVVKPLAEVKRIIGEGLAAEKSKKAFIDEKKAELEKVLAAGKPLDGELKKYKIEVKKTGPFSAGGGTVPSIGQADAVLDAAFALTLKSPVAKKLIEYQDHSYYLKLRSVDRPKEADLAKNQDVVEKSVTTSLQGELMNTWVSSLQKTATVKSQLKTRNQPVAGE